MHYVQSRGRVRALHATTVAAAVATAIAAIVRGTGPCPGPRRRFRRDGGSHGHRAAARGAAAGRADRGDLVLRRRPRTARAPRTSPTSRNTTPNVTLETSRATNSTLTAFIRGVGQQDPVAGFEQGVGIYLDDVYLNRPQGAVLDVYDVERIEVLRGPQGTLYGRNTIGGAVKYVTRRLDADDPTLDVRATLGNYGEQDLVVRPDRARHRHLPDRRERGALSIATASARTSTTGEENYNKDVLACARIDGMEPVESLSIRLSGDCTDDRIAPRQGYRLLPTVCPGAAGTAAGSATSTTPAGRPCPADLGEQEVIAQGGRLCADVVANSEAGPSSRSPRIATDTSPSRRSTSTRPPRSFEAPVVYTDDADQPGIPAFYTRAPHRGRRGVFPATPTPSTSSTSCSTTAASRSRWATSTPRPGPCSARPPTT